MTNARKDIVAEGVDGIYHCISRCVRRAFLCGFDVLSGKSFDHRKELIRERLEFLVGIFTIDVLDYALMSNHGHYLLRVLSEYCDNLSDKEVAQRWLTLYPPKSAEVTTKLHIELLSEDKSRIKILRKRLGSVSWFMKSLNEYIARVANKEDGCKGRFWEGRFKCQKIEDEAGLAACSIYINLNPVRAKIAKTPEESKYTSAYERIHYKDTWLPPIDIDKNKNGYLSMSKKEYLELLDWTGRQIVEGKKGAIPKNLKNILSRLKLKDDSWVETTKHYGKWYCHIVSRYEEMKRFVKKTKRKWCKGLSAAKISFAN